MAERLLQRIAQRTEGQSRRQTSAFVDEEELRCETRRELSRSVFVISPFADVADVAAELRRTLEGYFAKATAGDRIGTVHVTQGKEAGIVVFVLGTGADADGSRNWASARPNLFNAALTRAVKRLVVIGDYDLWSRKDGFDMFARHESLVRWRSRSSPDPFAI